MNGPVTPAQILGDLVEPLGRALTPAAAREILAVRASEAAEARIGELANKCDAGKLSPEERAEYQLYVEVGDVIALLQTRARLFLAQHGA